jgi:PDZ domain-containing protein
VSHNRKFSVSGAVFLVLVIIGLALPGSFLVQQAGPALDVTGKVDGTALLTISGASTYSSDTHFYMTTVSQSGEPQMGVPGAQALAALLIPDQQTIPIRSLYSKSETSEKVDEENAQMMTSSQDSGTVAGLEAAGYTVPMTVTIEGTTDNSPNQGKFQKGDVVKSIAYAKDGKTITTQIVSFSDLTGALRKLSGGSSVTVTVERDGTTVEVAATTAANEADSTGWVEPGSKLGIAVIPSDIQFPVTVKYGIENIGGPSAGSMFALAIYDRLTAGSLGDANKIAGTGTMSYDGQVGAIGGIQHKIVGAASQGAKYFLAPATNCSEVVGHIPSGMSVFAVRSIDDQIAAAKAIAAGDTSGLTTCDDVVAGSK